MSTPMAPLHPVLAAEARRAQALCQRDSAALAALAALMHPALRYVHATGLCHDRAAWLDYAAHGPRFERVVIAEPDLLDWGDTVLLRGRLQLRFVRAGETQAQDAESWVSAVWRCEAGGWQLVSMQSTRGAAP